MPPPPRDRTRTAAPPPAIDDNNEPDNLRPYTFHGLDLTSREGGRQQVCDCFVCGSPGKMTIEVNTSKFRCWSCNSTGNSLTFIRLLHEVSTSRTTPQFIDMVVKDRKLRDPSTMSAWGVCQSTIPPHPWLVAGYDTEGKITQLYKRTHIKGSDGLWSWRLLPTPGLHTDPGKSHALHMPASDFNPSRPTIEVMEGLWDGMAYWEVVQTTQAASDTNIVAVPGCNVWRDEWTLICKGKDVTLWFDSDYPRQVDTAKGAHTFQPGYDGMKRVSKKLSGHALTVSHIKWGEGGYDPTRPDGWDVRDALSEHPDPMNGLVSLISLVEPVPPDWFSPSQINSSNSNNSRQNSTIEPEACHSWVKCLSAWQEALEWRQELSDVLVTMLAVAASTDQSGDNQLFLRVIGDPGSAKTRLCKGLLVSRHCKLLLHLKSFHSGYKKEGGEDCSLVSRISGLCLVTPEYDALTIGGNSDQLESQVRQIFDGESGNTYANSDEDRHYRGLRSPWIQAGTPALMDRDQSRLGDRFLRIRIEQPSEEDKQAILMRALNNELSAMTERSNGTESSIIPPKLRRAYALTGGYVDWLRSNVEERVAEVERNMLTSYKQQCVDLGILTAEMRARPNMDPKKTETFPTKELPTRLVAQLGRLAGHLAVVMNKDSVDREVMRVVRKVAIDTAHGHTLNIVTWMCTRNPTAPEFTYQESGGIPEKRIAVWCGFTADKASNYLLFLKKIGVARCEFLPQGGNVWTLSERVYKLYLKVMSM